MPVIGTHVDNGALNSLRISAMNRSTVRKSVDRLQEMVKDRTPVETGELRASVHKKGPYRTTRRRWEGKVYSDNDHARHIEFGTRPHPITPKSGRALRWVEAAGGEFFARAVMHPGNRGYHMFQESAAVFSATEAEDIARANAYAWLIRPGFRPTFIDAGTRVS